MFYILQIWECKHPLVHGLAFSVGYRCQIQSPAVHCVYRNVFWSTPNIIVLSATYLTRSDDNAWLHYYKVPAN